MPPSKPKSKPGSLLLNLFSLLFITGSLLLLAYFMYTYINPRHALNPFAPPAPGNSALAAANTPVPLPAETNAASLQPETAESAAPIPTEAPPNGPTATLPAYPTATNVVINTAEPTLTVEQAFDFIAEAGTPKYMPHTSGCEGLYVAGHITDRDNNPLVLMTVQAAGILNGEYFLIEVFSGSNTNYTASGWEIKLSDALVNSTGSITIALYQQGGWEPISQEVIIDTFSDCSRNLVVVNFIQE